MKDIREAIRVVFNNKKNIVISIVAATFFGGVFIFASGMVTFFPEGPFIEFNPLRITTLIALALLAGFVVPMQWYAIGKARAGLKGSASPFGGILIGIATMSCCTPLLLPAILAFVGFSGTQLLFFNMTIRQYILPLSLFSVALLFVSLLMVARSVVASCRIDLRRTS